MTRATVPAKRKASTGTMIFRTGTSGEGERLVRGGASHGTLNPSLRKLLILRILIWGMPTRTRCQTFLDRVKRHALELLDGRGRKNQHKTGNDGANFEPGRNEVV